MQPHALIPPSTNDAFTLSDRDCWCVQRARIRIELKICIETTARFDGQFKTFKVMLINRRHKTLYFIYQSVSRRFYHINIHYNRYYCSLARSACEYGSVDMGLLQMSIRP